MIQNFKIHHSESGHFLSQTLLEGSAIHSEVIIKVCVFSLKRLICRIKPLLRFAPSTLGASLTVYRDLHTDSTVFLILSLVKLESLAKEEKERMCIFQFQVLFFN